MLNIKEIDRMMSKKAICYGCDKESDFPKPRNKWVRFNSQYIHTGIYCDKCYVDPDIYNPNNWEE